MEQFPKFVASRLARQQQSAEAHPDADTLTAFTENRLKPDARNPVLAHLAICSECREVLALVAGGAPPPAPAANPFSLWNLRWVAAFAVVCLVTVIVIRHPTTPVPSAPHVTHEVEKASLPEPPPDAPRAKQIVRKTVRPRIVVPKAQVEKPQPAPLILSSAAPQVDTIHQESLPTFAARQTIVAPPQPSNPTPQAMLPRSQPPRASFGLMPQRSSAKTAFLALKNRTLWRVDAAPGVLMASDDGGQTWRPVVVDSQTSFQALSVSGWDIWAGGDAGTLFHSLDNGLHWNQIVVSNSTARLEDTITAIETQGGLNVRLKTKSADWLSSDGGVTWFTK